MPLSYLTFSICLEMFKELNEMTLGYHIEKPYFYPCGGAKIKIRWSSKINYNI